MASAQAQREHGSSESCPGVFLACAPVQQAGCTLGSALPGKMKSNVCIYPQESRTFPTSGADKSEKMAAHSHGSLETLTPCRPTEEAKCVTEFYKDSFFSQMVVVMREMEAVGSS